MPGNPHAIAKDDGPITASIELADLPDLDDDEPEPRAPVWDLARVQNCPRLDFRCILWDLNYWDGPYSGICKFNDEPCYFSMDQTDGFPDYRLYFVYKLTSEEWEVERAIQELVETYVSGTHRRINGKLNRDARVPCNLDLYKKLVSSLPVPDQKAYLTREPVAWFDDLPLDVD